MALSVQALYLEGIDYVESLLASGTVTAILTLTTFTLNGTVYALPSSFIAVLTFLYMLANKANANKTAQISSGNAAPAPSPAPTPTPTNITSTSTPNGSVITYQYDGQTIAVVPNSPIGQVDTVNGQKFTVGQAISAPFTTSTGTQVPVGAVYIGAGQFELNGNYYS
jgi:secreted protein with Ig-like and vWFA domain